MNLKIFGIIGVLLVSGCASVPHPIKCEPIEVKTEVPVPVPAPPTIITPRLPIQDLTEASTPGDVAVAYRATIVQLEGIVKQFQDVLDKYMELSKDHK